MSRRRLALAAWVLGLVTPLCMAAQQGVTAQQGLPAQQDLASKQTVEQVAGRVVSALDGHPLAHARVTLVRLQGEKLAATAFADEDGRFRFEPVPAGKYRMTGFATNYLSAAYLPHDGFSTAIVTGAGLATDALEIRLNPVCTISGRVLDDQEPVQRATVSLYVQDPGNAQQVRRRNVVQTDEDGAYEFSPLGPGRYFIAVSGAPWYAVHPPMEQEGYQGPYRAAIDPSLNVAYPVVFYPDALDSAAAVPIALKGGDQFVANMQMHPEPALTVTLRPANGEKPTGPNQRYFQFSQSIFGMEEPVAQMGGQSVDKNGNRIITGVAPGKYIMAEVSTAGMPGRSRAIQVGTGSTSFDAEEPSASAKVTIALHMANGEPLPTQIGLNLRRLSSNQANQMGGTQVNEKGIAEYPNVPLGEYWFDTYGGNHPLHIVAMSVNGKPVDDRRLRIVSAGEVSVEVSLSQAVVQVEGFVRREGKPAAASFVVLVPAESAINEELFRRDQSDLDGSFTFNDVTPGNYIVIAVDDESALHWTDLPTLTPYLLHGVPVSVRTSGSSPVRLAEPVAAQPR